MKTRPAILRLWVLAFLALGSGLLLRNRNPGPSRENDATGAQQITLETPATPASYAELPPHAKAPEAKACCDKPPTRAALMRNAPPAANP